MYPEYPDYPDYTGSQLPWQPSRPENNKRAEPDPEPPEKKIFKWLFVIFLAFLLITAGFYLIDSWQDLSFRHRLREGSETPFWRRIIATGLILVGSWQLVRGLLKIIVGPKAEPTHWSQRQTPLSRVGRRLLVQYFIIAFVCLFIFGAAYFVSGIIPKPS